jgi:hypothetical protein
VRRCAHCGDPLLVDPLDGRRAHARFCSTRCRKRAYRRRQRGVPENAHRGPRGASRGRGVPLGDPLTDSELVLAAKAAFPRAA